MKLRDDTGAELQAEFSVARTELGFDVILESRGGVKRKSSGERRNTDYAPGLLLLLARMSRLGLTLQQARIASSTTGLLTPEQKRLDLRDHPYPVQLADLMGFEALRLDLGRALAAFKATEGSKGRGTSAKRLRLSVAGPGLEHMSVDAVAGILGGGATGSAPEGGNGRELKYAPIGTFLRGQSTSEVRLSLKEIARLVGPLGPSAASPQFWANARDHQLSRRKHWFDAGFEAFYEPSNQSVRFVRSPGRRFENAPVPIWTEPPTPDPGLLAESVSALREKLADHSGPLPPPPGSTEVQKVLGQATRYSRDPNIIAWVLKTANGRCEVCEKPAPFTRPDGSAYLEVHHVLLLAEGGPDTVDNAVAACPNCHRRLHLGNNPRQCCAELIGRIDRIKDYANDS